MNRKTNNKRAVTLKQKAKAKENKKVVQGGARQTVNLPRFTTKPVRQMIGKNGFEIRQIIVDPVANYFTRDGAIAISKFLGDHFGQRYVGQYTSTVRVEEGYRSGKMSDLNTNPNIFSYEDYDAMAYSLKTDKEMRISQLILYFVLRGERQGGCLFGVADSNKNDCLIIAINMSFNSMNRKSINPETIKEKLGLERNDKLCLGHIEAIQDLIRINIKVVDINGETIHYRRNPNFKQYVTIQLDNEHFTTRYYVEEQEVQKFKELGNVDVKFGTAKRRTRLNSFRVINFYGDSVTTLENSEFKVMTYAEYRQSCFKSYNYYHDIKLFSKNEGDELEDQMKEELKKYSEINDKIRDISENKLNLRSTKKILNQPLRLLAHLSYGTKYAEKIGIEESKLLKINGGLYLKKNGEYENSIQYDFNSAYPSIMVSETFPMAEGEWSTTTIDRIYAFQNVPYGIYDVQVEYKKEYDGSFFRYSNLYTHVDLLIAKKLGLKITGNDKINVYLYKTESRQNGKTLFGPTIDFLYEMKLKGMPHAKFMLASIWGQLVASNTVYEVVKDQNQIKSKHKSIKKITYISPTETKIEFIKNDEPFKTGYARIGPFLTAFCRLRMVEEMLKVGLDNIVYVRTDGFVSTKAIPNFENKTDLGCLKIEKQGKCELSSNSLKPIFT